MIFSAIIITLTIIIIITIYNYNVLSTLFRKKKWLIISIISLNFNIIPLLLIVLLKGSAFKDLFEIVKIAMIEVLLFIIPQILLVLLFFIQDIILITKKIFNKNSKIKRSKIFIKISLLPAFLLFCFVLYNIVSPLNNFDITRVNLNENSEKGLKIVQISDLHLVSFTKSDYKGLEKMVELCNSENPDIIAITGDIISNYPSELNGYEPIFESLKATHGKYFIYGNHDVGTYNNQSTKQQKLIDISELKSRMEKMGYIVLRDSIAKITTSNDSIYLMGVDESNRNSYVNRYNDIYNKIPKGSKIVSLSHNPHYFDIISSGTTQPNVFLTLAGHTHAMQIEFYIPFFGNWSPSELIHKYSNGLYKVGNMNLYVNKGIGHHIYRRIGATAEITVYTL